MPVVIHVYRYAMVALYTVFWGLIACVGCLLPGGGERGVWVARSWIDWILATCHVRVEPTGLENIPQGEPIIFMSNHSSVFDIAAIIKTLPVSFRFVAKRELTRIPFFGWGLVAAGHVIVDRKDREKAVASLQRAAEQIRGGTNVIVFPEGTRSVTGELGEFKSGGFHLALQSGVPIVPVSVRGSQEITPKSSLRIEGGTIRLHYGKPIPTAGLDVDQRNALKADVRQAILQGLDPASPGR